MRLPVATRLFVCLVICFQLSSVAAQVGIDEVFDIEATGETESAPSSGEAANGVCIWVHPADPALSTVISTDTKYCLQVCDLDGTELQRLRDGRMANVDVRYNFPLADEFIDIVCATDTLADTVRIYRVDPATRQLIQITGDPIDPDGDPDGCAIYRDPDNGVFYVFVTTTDDLLEQYELSGNPDGTVDGTLVRTIELGNEAEDLVADDERGEIYVAVKELEIRRYSGDPDADDTYTVIDTAGEVDSHLTASIQGLALYKDDGDGGYLIASSQGANHFVVYDRVDGTYVLTFRVVGGDQVDGVARTDGIAVANSDFGGLYGEGLFVCQDGNNTPRQNFKYAPWADIAAAVDPPLTIDTEYDPRLLGGDESAPDPVTGVTAVADETRIEVSWDASSDADSNVFVYEVIRDGATLAYVSDTSFVDESMGAGIEASYEIVAFNPSGIASAASEAATASAEEDETAPTMTSFVVGAGRDHVFVTFDEAISIDGASADVADYWDPDLTVTGLSLEPDGQTILIDCGFLYDESFYRFELTGITDSSGNEAADLYFEFRFTLVDEVVDLPLCCWHDDAEESDDDDVSLSGRDLEIGDEEDNVAVALRYPGIPIGRGGNVKDAAIQFTADSDDERYSEIFIYAELEDDAEYYFDRGGNLSSRVRTEEFVEWIPEVWFDDEQDANERTPNLSNVLEEVLSLPSWRAGNAASFIFTGTGLRDAQAYERDVDDAAYLHLEYERTETTYATLPTFRRGDVNADDRIDVSDVVEVLHYLHELETEVDCPDAADVDDSGELEISDVFTFLGYLFFGEGPPPATYGVCEVDPTVDLLDCTSYDGCL